MLVSYEPRGTTNSLYTDTSSLPHSNPSFQVTKKHISILRHASFRMKLLPRESLSPERLALKAPPCRSFFLISPPQDLRRQSVSETKGADLA